jgi:hypothetical protein
MSGASDIKYKEVFSWGSSMSSGDQFIGHNVEIRKKNNGFKTCVIMLSIRR